MSFAAGRLLRDARQAAGLTQQQLAARLHTTQSAVARLESDGANPRIATLRRALSACGRELSIDATAAQPSIDASLVAAMLRLTPAERMTRFESGYTSARALALAGRDARGGLA